MGTLGRIYDSHAAAHFLHVTTQIEQEVVQKFMASKDLYELGIGIIPPDIDLDGATAASIRAAHPEFFPSENIDERYLDTGLQRDFIAVDAGLDWETITRLQAAEHEYMRAIGIVS